MNIFSKNNVHIDPDDQELIKKLMAGEKVEETTENNQFQDKMNQLEKEDITFNHKRISRKEKYRPSKMSDSFLSFSPKNKDPQKREQSFSKRELEQFDTQYEMEQPRPAKKEKALDEPHTFEVVEKKVNVVNKESVTAKIDTKELEDYMHKHTRVNRLVVSIIVGVIVIVAIIVIIYLIMNLRKAGQSSPLGGV